MVEVWHHCALAAIAMRLKWLRERKQRVEEGSTVGGWLEATLVRLHAKEEWARVSLSRL